jgi:hypothetical protein
MNIVSIWLWLFNYSSFNKLKVMPKLTQCSPEVSPCGAIFRSILAANIANYGQLPKTLNMTPPELMRNPG